MPEITISDAPQTTETIRAMSLTQIQSAIRSFLPVPLKKPVARGKRHHRMNVVKHTVTMFPLQLPLVTGTVHASILGVITMVLIGVKGPAERAIRLVCLATSVEAAHAIEDIVTSGKPERELMRLNAR